MKKQIGKDLTTGSILKHLLVFALPMLIGNLLQSGNGIADTYWVGNYIGPDAIGAISVTTPIQFMLIALASGATLATSILVSQYYGAKEYEEVKNVIKNSFTLTLILGSVLTIIGLVFGDVLLRALNTSPAQFEMASVYFRLIMISFLPMFFSFLIAAILRGIGDTVTPLLFMALGLILNIILDPLMIIGVGPFPKMGISGAAIATITSQIIALLVSIIYLNKSGSLVALRFGLSKMHTYKIIKVGLPSMIQQSLVAVGTAFITGIVNNFGPNAMNAFGGCGRIEQIIFLPALSVGMAVSALTGQNLGANKPDRVKQTFKWGFLLTSVITITLSFLVILFSDPILKALGFGSNLTSLAIAKEYLFYVGPCYLFFAIMFVSNGILNGAGKTVLTMFFSLLSLWFIRAPLALLMTNVFHLGTKGIWLSIDISFFIVMCISLISYKSGTWEKDRLIKDRPLESEPVVLDEVATANQHQE